MINNFMSDIKMRSIGSWSGDDRDGIPDLIRPTMIVLQAPEYNADLISGAWDDTAPERWDCPVIGTHRIMSFRDVITKNQRIYSRWLFGRKFVSYETLYSPEMYLIFVYVR